ILISWINSDYFSNSPREKQLFLEEVLELCRVKNFSVEEKKNAIKETIKLSETTDNAYVLNAALKLVLCLGNQKFFEDELAAIEKNSKIKDFMKNDFIKNDFIKNKVKELKSQLNKH
ncbi:MAG: hypothetical protein K2M95_03840, partial [Clostridiales bacterium]|nr:hypothetical protein [Clostridiales bacterium]